MEWVNQGNATVEGSTLTVPAESGSNYHLLVEDLGSWLCITVALDFPETSCDFMRGGLFLRDSTTGELRGFGVYNDGGTKLATWKLASPTAEPDYLEAVDATVPRMWLRINASGSMYLLSYSLDGDVWFQLWDVEAPFAKDVVKYHDQWGVGFSSNSDALASLTLREFTKQ